MLNNNLFTLCRWAVLALLTRSFFILIVYYHVQEVNTDFQAVNRPLTDAGRAAKQGSCFTATHSLKWLQHHRFSMTLALSTLQSLVTLSFFHVSISPSSSPCRGTVYALDGTHAVTCGVWAESARKSI